MTRAERLDAEGVLDQSKLTDDMRSAIDTELTDDDVQELIDIKNKLANAVPSGVPDAPRAWFL